MHLRVVLVALLVFTPSISGECLGEAPGTYELLVCKGSCTFDNPTNVVVRGVLFLTAVPFVPEALSPFSPKAFEYAYGYDAEPNGCFVLDTVAKGKTFAGLIELGMTAWTEHSDQLRIPLYASADAWHSMAVRLTRDGFEGTGKSVGAGAAAPGYDTDHVIARRIGPPNLDQCVGRAWEQQRKGRDAA
jgi:hypothetical protein